MRRRRLRRGWLRGRRLIARFRRLDAAEPVAYRSNVTPRAKGFGPFPFFTAALVILLAAEPLYAAANALDDASRDQVHATKVVPDPQRKVGEVKLLARGNAVVVQTLLSTKLLERVTSEIRKKEEGNWPAGDPSREAYLAALERTREAVEKRDVGVDWKQRRRRLLIEFAADDANAAVFLGTFRFTGEGSSTVEREVLETLELPRSYVLRNMRLILADSFQVAESEVDSIGPLGPASNAAAPKGAASPAPQGAAS
jgi:hypothetical protein